MYTFHYQLTDEDYIEYNLYHHFTIPAFRSRLMMQRFLIPALLMAILLCIGTAYDYPIINYVIYAAFPVGWIVFFKKLMARNMRKGIKTIEASGKLPYAKESTAVFDDEKIKFVTSDTEMSISYSAIEKIVIGKNALYLYKNAITAHIMPYRTFASEEEKESFLQFIKQKTNAAVITGVTK